MIFFSKKKSGKISNKGIALISVMFVLFFLITMASTFIFSVQLEQKLAEYYSSEVKAHFAAKAGIYRAIGELRYNNLMSGTFTYPEINSNYNEEQHERNEEVYNNIEIGDCTYSVGHQNGLGLIDESSLIDINAAILNKRQVMIDILMTVIDNESLVEKILDLLKDYVDPDEQKELYGAEYDDYESFGIRIADRNMRDPDEFLNVLNYMRESEKVDIDDAIWFGGNGMAIMYGNRNNDDVANYGAGIRRFFTTYTGTADVNQNTASPELLAILYPDTYESILTSRTEGPVGGSSARVYRISATGQHKRYKKKLEWTVKMQGGNYPDILRMTAN